MTTSPEEVDEQTVAHGAAGRAGFFIKVVRRGPVNGAVRPNMQFDR